MKVCSNLGDLMICPCGLPAHQDVQDGCTKSRFGEGAQLRPLQHKIKAYRE